MRWRLANSLEHLRSELNTYAPDRDKSSDGTIAGTEHHTANPHSDHEPNTFGVVRALDVDAGPGLYPDEAHDQLADVLAEHVRQLGLAGFPALQGGGYVIWGSPDGQAGTRIASEIDAWAWRPYHGYSAHREHVHISVGHAASAYDSGRPWGALEALRAADSRVTAASSHSPQPVPARPPAPRPAVKEEPMPPTVRRGDENGTVKVWQGVLFALELLAAGEVVGHFGPRTEAATKALQHRRGLTVDGIAGPATWRAALGVK